jgi:hypothetical protein
MTVYCSCPTVFPLKERLPCALFYLTLKKERIFAGQCIYVFQIILLERID